MLIKQNRVAQQGYQTGVAQSGLMWPSNEGKIRPNIAK